jgi:hypothetical protein
MSEDNLSQISERVEDVSLQISRLDERVDTFKLNEKISRLSSQLYFLAVVAIAGGISGGVLYSRFKVAEERVGLLEENLNQAEEDINGYVATAKQALDEHVQNSPELKKLYGFAEDFQTLISSPNIAGRSQLFRTPDISTRGKWHDPVMVPPGYYIVGIRVKHEGKQGFKDDTGLNAIELYCAPFKKN